jgi:glutaredoxin
MTKLKVFFTAIIVSLILYGMPTAGEIYKWVDENGVIHLKDTPPQNVTPSMNIEKIPINEYDSQDVQDSEPAAEKNNLDSNITSSISVQPKKRKTPRVELYTTSWCFYCKKARGFFRSRGIVFTEYDIEKDKSAARRKERLAKGGGVPLAVINGKVISGFNKTAYAQALRGNP